MEAWHGEFGGYWGHLVEGAPRVKNTKKGVVEETLCWRENLCEWVNARFSFDGLAAASHQAWKWSAEAEAEAERYI